MITVGENDAVEEYKYDYGIMDVKPWTPTTDIVDELFKKDAKKSCLNSGEKILEIPMDIKYFDIPMLFKFDDTGIELIKALELLGSDEARTGD